MNKDTKSVPKHKVCTVDLSATSAVLQDPPIPNHCTLLELGAVVWHVLQHQRMQVSHLLKHGARKLFLLFLFFFFFFSFVALFFLGGGEVQLHLDANTRIVGSWQHSHGAHKQMETLSVQLEVLWETNSEWNTQSSLCSDLIMEEVISVTHFPFWFAHRGMNHKPTACKMMMSFGEVCRSQSRWSSPGGLSKPTHYSYLSKRSLNVSACYH